MSYENVIYVKKYNADDANLFPVNEQEIWRYSGYLGLADKVDNELKKLLEEVVTELKGVFHFQVCYRRMELTWKDDMPLLPFESSSKDLAKCLNGSSEIVLFAATVGLEVDRKIARYERLSPAKALLMHAYGAERVESLCDHFCKEIEDEVINAGLETSPRFSPGYGDLPLETQVDFFRLMDCNRKIGVSLNDSLLMTPSKSVTAIFGVGSCNGENDGQDDKYKNHKCEKCGKIDCEFRKA